jgi:hypothetical protein
MLMDASFDGLVGVVRNVRWGSWSRVVSDPDFEVIGTSNGSW